VVKASRESVERELLWNIALDGDPVRREQLYRMLVPAANDQLSMVPSAKAPLPLGNHEDHE
jgi:hexokinase